MKNVLPPIEIPELFVGIVARMGVEVADVAEAIEHEFRRYGYKGRIIRITDLLKQHQLGANLKEGPSDARYDSYITACNKAREDAVVNELFAFLSLLEVKNLRRRKGGDPNTPRKGKTVFIFSQFKRPEETSLLREVYGERFIQVSCHAPYASRVRWLSDKIIGDHPEDSNEGRWEETARRLIERDESEEGVIGGQRVREVFPDADVIINAANAKTIRADAKRFLELLFAAPNISPTFFEYANNLAFQASYRSLDLSRQVGASIFDSRRRVLALGCNEVPKAGGGTYWEDDRQEYRDVRVGYDINAVRKRGLVIDVVKRLKEAGKLIPDLQGLDDLQLEPILIGSPDGPLSKADVLSILEYGRAVHAEMNAITDAASGRGTLEGATLFCTTFPCHNCAKHIVASGIAKVVYLQPYPKSSVTELYPDSIEVDPEKPDPDHIPFYQFVGVTSRRFHLFAQTRRKDLAGRVHSWKPKEATPNVRSVTVNYFANEDRAIAEVWSRLRGEAVKKLAP